MISESQITSFIGQAKFSEYFQNPEIHSLDLAVMTYKFDIQLRGLLINALGVLEVGLRAQLISKGLDLKFTSFGHVRKVLDLCDSQTREQISRNLGAKNYKQLRGALQNLNYLRNRVAHHERIWNHRNPFAFPDMGNTTNSHKNLPGENRRSLAWSLIGILQILSGFPKLITLEADFEGLLSKTPVDRKFLLKSMGFEVP